jgi:hypothetical protein
MATTRPTPKPVNAQDPSKPAPPLPKTPPPSAQQTIIVRTPSPFPSTKGVYSPPRLTKD